MKWELDFIKWADGWWSSPFLDYTIPWLTYLGSHVAVVLFILITFIITKQRKILRRLLLLYGIQSAIVYGLKFLIQRERPFHFMQEMVAKLSKGPGEILDPSFPSAHAALSFMMATLLAYWFPRFGIIFYVIASFIAWTRIYLGLHFPTDVLVGSLL
ncbi:MAG: phosphatase PAP2 family protein, partial [Deltaproteobacteria bacterium]|nr:phosphatase PAP2 family protein [Deltaproteobacteria bacterium]